VCELDAVDEVTYTLHPSFPEPVQRMRDRETNFRLSASGWGEFLLKASIRKKDESTEELTHWLKLRPEITAKAPASAERDRNRVFLSFGAADAPMAQAIGASLAARGVEVDRSDQPPEGMPPEAWSERAVSGADATLVIWTNRFNRWMEREVALAREFRKPILPLVVYGPTGSTPEIPTNLQEQLLPIKWVGSGAEANEVAERVLDVLAKIPPTVA
jgi:hypothetical protein